LVSPKLKREREREREIERERGIERERPERRSKTREPVVRTILGCCTSKRNIPSDASGATAEAPGDFVAGR
jgi:hypothetical protein